MPDIDDARLANLFTEFRREVTPYVNPPGTAAARRWVRNRRRRGAAAIAAGAVLFVGGPTVGFVAASDDAPKPPPVTPTIPPTPTPGPTTPPPTTPPARTDESTPPDAGALPEVTGKIFYIDLDGKLYLNGRQYPGGNPANVTVSPDGKRVMWVDQNVTSKYGGGDLIMSDLDGGNRRVAGWDIDPLCQEPVWSGDSTRVLRTSYSPAGPGLAVSYLAGGAGDHLGKPEGCHYRWSADGERVAFSDGEGETITVQDLYGGGHKVVLDRDVIGGRFYVDLSGISADGSRICVSTTGPDGTLGDVARGIGCDTMIDVAKRKVITINVDKDEVRSGMFVADGGLLATIRRDDQLELLRFDADDRLIARSVVPAPEGDLRPLSYTP